MTKGWIRNIRNVMNMSVLMWWINGGFRNIYSHSTKHVRLSKIWKNISIELHVQMLMRIYMYMYDEHLVVYMFM